MSWTLFLLSASCGDDDTPTAEDGGTMTVMCGEGTVKKGNECVVEGPGSDGGTMEMAVKCGTGTVETDGMCVPDPDKTIACGDGTMNKDGKCVVSPPSPNIEGPVVTHLALRTQGTTLDGTAGADTLSQFYPVEISIGITYKGDPAFLPLAFTLMKTPSEDTVLPSRDEGDKEKTDILGCVIGGMQLEHPGGADPTEAIASAKLQIPRGCLEPGEAERRVSPVVIIDPDRQLHAKDQDAVSRAIAFYKANTHDKDLAMCRRNAETGSTKDTCALEVNVAASPGIDFELQELSAESSVLVIDKCGDTAPHGLTLDAWKSLVGDPTSQDNNRPPAYRCNAAIIPDFKIKMKEGGNGPVADLDQYGNKQLDLDNDGHPQIATVEINGMTYPSFLYGEADLALDATVVTYGETASDVENFDEAMTMVNVASPVAHNALKDHGLQIRYQIRPESSSSDADWRPLYMHNKGEQAKADEQSTSGQDPETFEENTAVPATPSYYTHGVYLENDCGEKNKDTCDEDLTPRDDLIYGSWANQTNFTVRACLVPVNDSGSDDMSIDKFPGNNCKNVSVLLIRRATNGNTHAASSYGFNKDWGDGAGNTSTVRARWALYTHNNIDTAGASTDNQASVTLESSLLGATDIIKAWGRVAARVSLVGSYYDYGVSSFGEKLWGESREVPEYHWDRDFKVSKEKSKSFRVQAGPIPVSVGFRLYGEAGLLITLDVIAVGADAATTPDDQEILQKFPGSTRIGLAMAGATPHGLITATASAGVDLLVFRAGVAGQLTVVRINSPLTGYLGWGMTSLNPIVLRAGVWADFKLDFGVMAGRVYVFAEHWEIWGCGWSICSGWNRFWDLTIANWSGWNWNQTLWSSPYYAYDVKF